jgi:hypothetical protein
MAVDLCQALIMVILLIPNTESLRYQYGLDA